MDSSGRVLVRFRITFCMLFGILFLGCPPEEEDSSDVPESLVPTFEVPDTALVPQLCPGGCSDDGDPCTYETCHPLEGCQTYLRGEFVVEAQGIPWPPVVPKHMVLRDGLLYVADLTFGGILTYNPATGQSLGRAQINLPGLTPWGLALGPDNLLYIADVDSGVLSAVDPDTRTATSFPLSADAYLPEPRGLNFGEDGAIYVCASFNDTVLRFSGAEWGDYTEFISSGSGGLEQPTDLVFGPDGNLYVASRGSNEVLRYDGENGTFIDVFVEQGYGGMTAPSALEFYEDDGIWYLLVATSTGHTVLRYEAVAGSFVDEVVSSDEGSLGTSGLAIIPTGELLVGGGASQDIRRYELDTGDPMGVVAAYADWGETWFLNPGYPTLHGNHIYVNSHTRHAVYRFDAETGFFDSIFVDSEEGGLHYPTGMAFGPDGHLYVAAFYAQEVLRFDGVSGQFDTVVAGGLGQIRGMEFGPDGMLYVVGGGTGNWRVKQIDPDTGATVDFTENVGAVLSIARDLTFGLDGLLYVASYVSSQVVRFDAVTGKFVDFIAQSSGGGGLPNPRGVTFGPDGLLYVTYHTAVIRFDPVSGDRVDKFIGSTTSYSSGRSFQTDGPGEFNNDGFFFVADQRLDSLYAFAPPLGPCGAGSCGARSYCDWGTTDCLATGTYVEWALCDDSDPCTTDDQCEDGKCVGMPTDCDDQDPCTLDTCNTDGDCEHVPLAEGNVCDDGDPCTTDDQCVAGTCAGAEVDCDDGEPCTADSCDAEGDCVHAQEPDGTPCTPEFCVASGDCGMGICLPPFGPLPDPCHDTLQVAAHQFQPQEGKVNSSQIISLIDLEAGSATVGSAPVYLQQPADPSTGFFKGEGPVHGPTLVATGDAASELALTVDVAGGTLTDGASLPCPVAVHLLLLWDSLAGTIQGTLDADHAVEFAALDSSGNIVDGPDGNPLVELVTAPPGGPPPADVVIFAPAGLYQLGMQEDCGGVTSLRVRFPASASAQPKDLPFYHVLLHYLP
jgi:DNA-binding beta-propeller fold protein YncE